jgi:hypothetical protein
MTMGKELGALCPTFTRILLTYLKQLRSRIALKLT